MALNPVNYSQYLQGTTAAESMFGDVMKAREYSQTKKVAEAEAQKKAQMDELILRFAKGSNPSIDDYVTLSAMTTDKAQAAKLNKIWGEKTKAQQNSELLRLSNIFSVLGVKDIELAKNYIQEAADADPKNAEQYAAAIKVAETDPDLARSGVASILVNIPGGKDALDAILKNEAERRKRDKFSPELRKMEAEASSAETAAAFAPDKAALELGKLNLDFQKIAGDIEIQKLDKKIKTAEQIAQGAKNQVAQEKMQIELENLKRDRDEKLAEKVEKAKNSAMMSDNLLETTDEILSMALVKNEDGTPVSLPKSNDPKFEQKIGKLINLTARNATGPVQARTPTLLSRDVSDLESLVGQLGDQILIDRIDLMSGVLTQSDADALKKSLKSLDMKSSPERLLKNVIRIQELTQKARKISMERYGAVEGTSIPDTPTAAPSPEEVQAIYEKYRQR